MSAFAPTTTTRKVLYVLYGTMLVLAVSLLVWVHNSQIGSLQKETRARLGGITSTLAAQLDGGRVTRLLSTYDRRGAIASNTQDPWYYVMHETLRKSAEANAYTAPLRIVAFDAEKRELRIVCSSTPEPEFRAAYTSPCATAIVDHLSAMRVDGQRGTYGNQVTSFDVVRDSHGAIIGAIIAEEPLDELVAAVRGSLWRNIGITAVVFLLIGLFLFRSVGRLVQREENERRSWQERHAGMADSIAYAGKIQGALIPRPERFREQFEDFFVLNRPKDVVSGDFHWYHRINDEVCFVATADCTGHGLPGAMMAAIGCSLLNEVVTQNPALDPAEVLAQLSERMVFALNQNGQRMGAGDGMDIALCRVDRSQREILFAGALRPLYWIHEGQLTVINGDRKPIGGSQHQAHRKFSVHRIAYHAGDRIYLFSDGYVDQFGGPLHKKFMPTRLGELLTANQHLPMTAQQHVLDDAFLQWKGDNEQMDDVCVLGIAV